MSHTNGIADIETIRTQVYQFNRRLETDYWNNWIGIAAKVDLHTIFQSFPGLFHRNTVLFIKNTLKQTSEAEEQRRLRALLGNTISAYLENGTHELNEELLKQSAQSWIRLDGKKAPLRSLGIKISNEPDRTKRLLINKKQRAIVAKKLNPISAQIVTRIINLIQELGYPNYIEAMQETQNRDLSAFVSLARMILDDSESLYTKHLDRYLSQEIGVELNSAHITDLVRLGRMNKFDHWFRADQLIPVLHKTWEGLGFSLISPRITLDLEMRSQKIPRACVVAVDPPHDIRLTTYPTGGFQDYDNLLHESGHVQHFAHVRENLEIEYKYWGDRGFTEGMAYLFQHLYMNPTWLSDMIGMSDQTEFLEFTAFNQLRNLRRLLSSFLYEYELFEGQEIDIRHIKRRYAAIMTDGVRVPYTSENALSFDMEFYSAGYARARLLEAQVRRYLETHYTERWWCNKAAGAFLEQFWREGRRLYTEEVLHQLGYAGIDHSIYLDNIKRFLKE